MVPPHSPTFCDTVVLVAAHENAYFDTQALGSWLCESASGVQSLRETNRARLTKAVAVDSDRSELLHQYWPMPQLQLRLSFVSLRPHALEIPLLNRVHQVRAPYRVQARKESSSNVQRFEVTSHYEAPVHYQPDRESHGRSRSL